MKKNRINYFIIIGLLVLGVGSCSVATTQKGNAGFDAILPGLFGLICIITSAIYSIVFIISTLFLKKELKGDQEISFNTNRELAEYLRKKKLIKLISISMLAYCMNLIIQYFLSGRNGNINLVSIIITLTLLAMSYWGVNNKMKIAKIIWLTILFLLLYRSIMFVAITVIGNLYVIVLIVIPIAYLYVINMLIRSKLINNRAVEDMV